ncbi:MAG TPA: hypothetical protein VF487_03760 [Chitinophagaceae bacterium]
MATKNFVTLPVKDLNRSKDFVAKPGFTINPQLLSIKINPTHEIN